MTHTAILIIKVNTPIAAMIDLLYLNVLLLAHEQEATNAYAGVQDEKQEGQKYVEEQHYPQYYPGNQGNHIYYYTACSYNKFTECQCIPFSK